MRLVIVGAGSQSTPHLFLALDSLAQGASTEATLVGRNDAKTMAVATAIRSLNLRCTVEVANIDDELGERFAAADAIVLQPRYGGYEARLADEMIAQRFGVPGDEGLGPGGLANAWRSWPLLDALLRRIHRSSPTARVVFLTAPLGILTRCARAAYPSLGWCAICELPFSTLKDCCVSVGKDWRNAEFDYAGVNHLGWFDRLGCEGVDVIEALSEREETDGFPTASWIRKLGAVPLKYMELHYCLTATLARQRGSSRALSLRDAADRAIAAYARGNPNEIVRALELREARWYYEAVAPLLLSFAGQRHDATFFLTAENQGYLSNLADDAVVEIPHGIRGTTLRRCERTKPLRADLALTLERFVEFERIAAAAVGDRDRAGITRALYRHPWLRGEDAPKVSQEIVEAARPLATA
jgi:6-phospho-beta-glucosidase